MTLCRAEEAVHKILASDTDIAAAVDVNNINHDTTPQAASKNSIVIATDRVEEHSSLAGPTGYAVSQIKITVINARREAAQGIARDVRKALSEFRGLVTLSDSRTNFISCCIVGEVVATYAVTEDKDDEGRSLVAIPATISHQIN